jgi:hypothetical protein
MSYPILTLVGTFLALQGLIFVLQYGDSPIPVKELES